MRRFVGSIADQGLTIGVGSDPPHAVDRFDVLFRGYVADPEALLARLERDAPPPASEAELHARCFARGYERWGQELPRHMRGEYAVAIRDRGTGTLLIAHDMLGLVPVYYREGQHELTFATHLELVVESASSLELDEQFIADYVCYGDHYGNRTPFAAIKRLPPGVSLERTDRGTRTAICWSLAVGDFIQYADEGDYAAHLSELVRHAVSRAMRPVGRTWCELSGGLDSSTVLCTAAKTPHAPDLASVSFVYPRSRSADETRWINAVTEACGTASHRIDADAAYPFKELPTRFFAQPEHAMVNFSLHKAYETVLAKHNVDVVLTGMGGDAVLYGDGPEPFFLADLLRHGRLRDLTRQLWEWAEGAPQQRPARFWLQRCAAYAAARHWRRLTIQDQPPKISWIRAGWQEGARRNGVPRTTWVPPGNDVGTSWYLERVLRSANVVSFWGSRAAMGTAFRHPLMSVPLVEFMGSIPWHVRFTPAMDRALHRRTFRGVLPEIVATRQTKSGPDQAMYRGLEVSSAWQRALTDRTQIVERGYVDHRRWEKAVSLAMVGRCESIKHFKATATLEVWLRQLQNPGAATRNTDAHA